MKIYFLCPMKESRIFSYKLYPYKTFWNIFYQTKLASLNSILYILSAIREETIECFKYRRSNNHRNRAPRLLNERVEMARECRAACAQAFLFKGLPDS